MLEESLDVRSSLYLEEREREKVSVVVEIVFMEEGEKNEGRLRGGGDVTGNAKISERCGFLFRWARRFIPRCILWAEKKSYRGSELEFHLGGSMERN